MTHATSVQTSPIRETRRVAITPWVAAGVFVAYVVVVNGIQMASGVPYTAFFASADNAMRSAVASLAAGAVLLFAFATWSRWDGLWRDAVRRPMTRAMWVAPAVMVGILVARIALKLSHEVPVGLLGPILLAGIGVGFTEETLFRGIVLRSLRDGDRPEAWAMLISSAWFGAMHLTNAFLGSPLYIVAFQVVLASIQGATLYQFRRSTGLLAAGMVVHGLWDISTFLPSGGSDLLFEGVAIALVVVAGLTSAIAVLRHDRARPATPRAL